MNDIDIMQRYSRQILFDEMGLEGQKKLMQSSVLIIGCGALGTYVADGLTRAGVGKIVIVDRDFCEMSNLQRQILFDEEDARRGVPKAIAAKGKLEKINSSLKIEAHIVDVTARNIEKLIEGVSLVIDGTDNLEIRYLINDACIKHKIPWIYGAVIGSSGMSMNILPNEGPCLKCLFPEPPPAGSIPTCDISGVLSSAVSMITSVQITEAFKILTGSKHISHELLCIDVWYSKFQNVEIKQSENCPVCVNGKFDYLERRETSWTTALCGRNAVQVTPSNSEGFSLDELREKLSHVDAFYNGYLLQIKLPEYEIIVFPDARAIIKGTTDEAVGRSIYSRYIGM